MLDTQEQGHVHSQRMPLANGAVDTTHVKSLAERRSTAQRDAHTLQARSYARDHTSKQPPDCMTDASNARMHLYLHAYMHTYIHYLYLDAVNLNTLGLCSRRGLRRLLLLGQLGTLSSPVCQQVRHTCAVSYKRGNDWRAFSWLRAISDAL